MQFLATVPTFGSDTAVKSLWSRIREKVGDMDGICYYKHPIIPSVTRSVPDLTLLARGYEPVAIKCINIGIDEIETVGDSAWTMAGQVVDSPQLEVEDYVVGLQSRFSKERPLRRVFAALGVLAFPLIARSEFEKKYGPLQGAVRILWADHNLDEVLIPVKTELGENDWALAKSVFQGVSPLNRNGTGVGDRAETMGAAIRVLDREIALLDEDQHKVAVQIAPGPQRIRGLAGTGKTVVLAMKAANLHLRYPEKHVLFTFNTQSLYNQARSLITKFYRINSDSDPDWDTLHVRHGWGGANRPGVYADACRLAGATPLTFSDARALDPRVPFRAACKRALEMEVLPAYDFILIDEAQDFPREFFQLLYRLATNQKCITWAYDELQSLTSVEIPTPGELFGTDEGGRPLVSLEGEEYEGGIEKDFVLHRSYRCHQSVLMLAHAIGLGIYSAKHPVQMLSNRSSWESIGYEVREGSLRKGENTVVFRPPENSPNRILEIYKGKQPLIEIRSFKSREAELAWVGDSIKETINTEHVRPEQIVVISLDNRSAKKYLSRIQSHLHGAGVSSTIPGLVDDTAEFAEPNMVTLSTVYRAKGNEAPIIYIVGFDSLYLYQYVDGFERRNQAFAAISRSKGWLRISGSGPAMDTARTEIRRVLDDVPYFKFKFPDMEHIRKLDASETSRRKREVRTAQASLAKLLNLDEEALQSLPSDMLKKLKHKLEGVANED